jgi:ADP-heptose:LPS heptosyltransferase
MAPTGPDKILAVMLGSLRDFVHGMAVVPLIREQNPQAQITLLTAREFESLAKASRAFDLVDPAGEVSGPGEWVGLIARLRSGGYRKVYDLHEGRASRSILTGLGLFGLKRASTPKSTEPPDMSWVLTQAPAPGRDGARQRPYAVLAPAISETPEGERWPAARYAELAKALQKSGIDVVIGGTMKDGDAARSIQHQAPGARDLTGGPDLARLALLCARARVVVGADCGLLHLAAATGAPTVVIYGRAGDPAQRAPRGHVTVLQAEPVAGLTAETVAHAVQLLSPEGVRSA